MLAQPASAPTAVTVGQRSAGRAWEYDSFNAEQLEFIRQPVHGPGKLLGVPGGGKTRTVLGRVAWLYEQGAIPPQGFLLLTFNRSACDDLLEKARELIPHVPGYDRAIHTIHSVAGSIVTRLESGGRSGDINTVVFHATRLLQALSPSGMDAVRSIGYLRNVCTIMVDEAQDLSETQYSFVQTLASTLNASLVLVGDPNQNIYQFQGGSDQFLRDHPGFCVTLVKNYRATAPLVEVIAAARPVPQGDLEAVGQSIPVRPRFVSNTVKKIAQDILAQVRDSLARGAHVAILGPTKKCLPSIHCSSKDPEDQVVNMGLQWVAQLLREEQIPMILHYMEGNIDAEDRRTAKRKSAADPQVRDTSVVHLMTIHGSKGLEFDDVLVLNFHHATMGRQPANVGEEREFAYLWYVALSRARSRMTVYRFAHRPVWPGIFEANLLPTFDVVGMLPTPRTRPPAQVALNPMQQKMLRHLIWIPVTELLSDRRLITEEHLANLQELWLLELCPLGYLPEAPTQTSTRTGDSRVSELPLFSDVPALFGLWAENTFYHAYRGEAPPCLKSIQKILECAVQVDQARAKDFGLLCVAIGVDASEPVRWCDIDAGRHGITDNRFKEVFEWLAQVRAAHPNWTHVFVYTSNKVQWFDLEKLRALSNRCDATVKARQSLSIVDLWTMTLFLWQYSAEAGWRWRQPYDDTLLALEPFDRRIRAWGRSLPDGWAFQVEQRLPFLPVSGELDGCFLDDARGRASILELKFSPGELNLRHGLQAAVYAEMLSPGFRAPQVDVEVWNLWTGERVRVVRTGCPRQRWRWYSYLSPLLDRPLVGTKWLYELEAVGTDARTCGLLRLHMQEVATGVVPISTWVRCANVPEERARFLGITSNMVDQAPTLDEVVQSLAHTLRSCLKPLMLACQGHKFGHLVLQRLLADHNANADGALNAVCWGDPYPLLAARKTAASEATKPGLPSLFEAITGSAYAGTALGAAADVDMLQRLIDKLGVSDAQWTQIARVGGPDFLTKTAT